MRLSLFLLVSTIFHGLLFLLPVSFDNPGYQEAIPVTLLVMEEASSPTPVPQGQKAIEMTPPDSPPKPPQIVSKPRVEQEPAPQDAKKQNLRPQRKEKRKKAELSLARHEEPAGKKETPPKREAKPLPEPVSPRTQQQEKPPPPDSTKLALGSEKPINPVPSEIQLVEWEEDSFGWTSLTAEDRTTRVTETARPAAKKEAVQTAKLTGRKRMEITPAAYAHWAPPDYPEQARREGWQGTTLLRILVDVQGRSKSVEVSQSSGFPILDEAALRAAHSWRFRPAHDGRKSIDSWVRVPIVFRLENRN